LKRAIAPLEESPHTALLPRVEKVPLKILAL
jgi:hypothetical protein